MRAPDRTRSREILPLALAMGDSRGDVRGGADRNRRASASSPTMTKAILT